MTSLESLERSDKHFCFSGQERQATSALVNRSNKQLSLQCIVVTSNFRFSGVMERTGKLLLLASSSRGKGLARMHCADAGLLFAMPTTGCAKSQIRQ